MYGMILAGLTVDSHYYSLGFAVEFCSGGDLDDALYKSKAPTRLRRVTADGKTHFDHKRAIGLMLDVARGMAYLHDHAPPIVHRDLKPANVLLADLGRHAKVTDFGLATTKPQRESVCGTGRYLPPEALRVLARPELKKRGIQHKPGDVYSFALMFNEVFSGRRPWAEVPQFLMQNLLLHQVPSATLRRRPKLENCTSDPLLKTLVQDCWAHEPSFRPTFDDIRRRLTIIKYNNKLVWVG